MGKKVDWSFGDWFGFKLGETFITIGPHSEVGKKSKEPQRMMINLYAKDVLGDFERIKKEKGPQLQVHGSGNLIQTLLEEDLVDELWLKIFPITLGKGKRLFEQGTISANFKLIESRTSPLGVIIASYRRNGEVKTGSF